MYRSDENKKKKNTHSQLEELVLHHFLTKSEVLFVFLTDLVLLTVHCAFEMVKFNHQSFRSPADIICQSDVADIRKNAACRCSRAQGLVWDKAPVGSSPVVSTDDTILIFVLFSFRRAFVNVCYCYTTWSPTPPPTLHLIPFFSFVFCHVFTSVFGHLSVMLSTLYICFLPRLSFPHTY